MKRDELSGSYSRDVARRTRRAGKAHVLCSPKNGRIEVRLESALELTVARALEIDPRVSNYRTQPFTVDLVTGAWLSTRPQIKTAGARYYTPDLVATVDGEEIVIEVKPAERLAKHYELFRDVGQALRHRGRKFVVVTEAEFPGHFVRNLELLVWYQTQCSQQLAGWASELGKVSERLRGPVRDVLQEFFPSNHYLAAGLLFGVLRFDLFKSLLERMDFSVEPAFGSLSSLEAISYESY